LALSSFWVFKTMVELGAEVTSSLKPRPTLSNCGMLCLEKRQAVLVPRAVLRI
jgi:hypothetical protein